MTFDFLFSLGYVTLGSSVMTMILTALTKSILKKAHVITTNMNASKKDIILSRTGRIIALIVYASFYVIDVLVIKKNTLVIDITLFASLISGSALTLCISKGFYTGLRQMSKKNSVFEKLEVAEETITKLEKEIKESMDQEEVVRTVPLDTTNQVQEQNSNKNKWIIKGE